MRRLLVLTLLALPLAGCLQAAPPAHVAPATPDDAHEPDARNAFLLDAPRPFTASVSRGAEPSILVDQAGRWIWIGDTSGLSRSEDGGATWTRSPNPFLPGLFGDGWALAQDADGALYAATTQGHLIGVARSDDGGATWATTASSLVTDAAAVADRPWLAARGAGEVALIQNAGVDERCSFSRDGGQTFLARNRPGYATPNPGNAVFGPDGALYFHNGARLFRFDAPCEGIPRSVAEAPSGVQIFAQVDVDEAGHVYTALPTSNNGAMTLRGTLGVQGFTRKTLVVSPPALVGNTFGTVSVFGDQVAVAWYGTERGGDFQDAAFDGAWNVYVARVQGFWTASPTITYARLSTEPNHVGDFCVNGIGCSTGDGDRDLLDYFMIDHGPDGALHVAYGHDGTGARAEVRYARLPPSG